MSLEIKPYAERRRQPTIALVAGTPERLRYITNDGESEEGSPEMIWRKLAIRESYGVTVMDKGKERHRIRMGSPPIVVAAKRGSIRDLVRTCDARHWLGLRSTHGKYKQLAHDNGPIVRRLGVTADIEDAATGLFTFVEFLNSHGVRFNGSVAGAALSLFRTTLTEPLRLWAPPEALNALWPGRREYWHEPSLWYRMQYFDLKAAYPAALTERGIPTHWHRIDPEKWRTEPDGFSFARTFTPYDNPRPNPLPLRLRPGTRRESISWATGAFSGTYPHRDLENASSRDCWIKPEETWSPTRYTEAFNSVCWQSLRQEMRSLTGLAGVLGKLADNGLWGMFAFDNSADVEVRWTTADGDMSKATEHKRAGMRKAHGIGVALAATARVRQSLWSGIEQAGAIYCDTDGMIAPEAAYVAPSACGEGSWYPKQALAVLEVKAPQVYRWANAIDLAEWKDGEVPAGAWRYLGESSPKNFLSAPVTKGQLHGDDMGTAPAMSVRQAYLRGLIKEGDE